MLITHSDRPRLSSSLVLLVSGLICLSISILLRWLSGDGGRSDSNPGHGGLFGAADRPEPAKRLTSFLPARAKRRSILVTVACIVARLEVLQFVIDRQQCSLYGVESCICLLLLAHHWITWQGDWRSPAVEDSEDPWRTFIDDLRDWMTGPRAEFICSLLGTLLISLGTLWTMNQLKRSNFLCFPAKDSRLQVISLQYVGVVLDAVIIVSLWRLMVWTRHLQMQLRVMSLIFVMSSTAMASIWLTSSIFASHQGFQLSLGHLHGLDVLKESLAFFLLSISLSLWMCEGSPITSLGMMTSLIGAWRASDNVFSLGDWMHLARLSSLLPLWLISGGLLLFSHGHDLRRFVFLGWTVLVIFMFVLLITATFHTFSRPISHFEKRHPINDLIYEARTFHDRWLLKAATSGSLDTAITVYKERHQGRSPPPKFGDWYQFAQNSTVIDEFPQIDADLSVFRSLPPATLRERARSAVAYPGVGSITVRDGQVTTSDLGDESKNSELRDVADMIAKFSKHLPDMILPININQTPRVLPSWTDQQLDSQEYLQFMAKTITKRPENTPPSILNFLRSRKIDETGGKEEKWPASRFRQMHAEACSSTHLTRATSFFEVGKFCSACTEPHSRGQLMVDWAKSLDTCRQPDLNYLHGFLMTNPSLPPIQKLVPLFGSFKMAGFADILLPSAPSDRSELDEERPFTQRRESLFWRGNFGKRALSEQTIRGSQKLRLLHLLAKTSDNKEKVTMILPVPGSDDFMSKLVLAHEANRDLPLNVSIDDKSFCSNKNCDLIKQLYGTDDVEDPLQYRYILMVDEDDGPPPAILPTLQSKSLPFISTIFQTWFTDRLTPWLHFVPIDTRYQGLHTTLLYFTGTAMKAKMGGTNRYLNGRFADAEWIAQQGHRWATKALQRRDMEIYLFRLLLEWGRLIDERRHEIGYLKDATGQYHSDEWSLPPER